MSTTTPTLSDYELEHGKPMPTQALDTLVEKTLAYFEMGVKSCWLVLPSLRAVAVYHQPHRYTFFSETDTLEDRHLKFSLPLAEVFSA